jgi:bifunctional UDP-N-acetylglucosamine pyrophosphorylase/glucosamine-1-phosphate N-acetyltransferase/UDP-N-acetylglucosamine pyrophosphorylase
MVDYVLDSLRGAGVARIIVVVGYRADLVRQTLAGRPGVEFALQEQQLGTGHAVQMARDALAGCTGPVIVVAGDSPMLRSDSLAKLLGAWQSAAARGAPPACLLGTTQTTDPAGLGRVVRDAKGKFTGIVEDRDATPAQKQITEVNMSTYVFHTPELFWALANLRPQNSQGEYYLTDCPALLLQAGRSVDALCVLHPSEALSINNPAELAAVEQVMMAHG